MSAGAEPRLGAGILLVLVVAAPAAAQTLSAGARQAVFEPPAELAPTVRDELLDVWRTCVNPALKQAWGEPYEVAWRVQTAELRGARRLVFRATSLVTGDPRPGGVSQRTLELVHVVDGDDLEPRDLLDLPAGGGEATRVGPTRVVAWRDRLEREHEGKRVWVSRHTVQWGGGGWWLRAEDRQGEPGRFVRADARRHAGQLQAGLDAHAVTAFLRDVPRPPTLSMWEASPALTGVPLAELDAVKLGELALERQAVAADGESRVVIRVVLPEPGRVTVSAPRGTVTPLLDGQAYPWGQRHAAYALYAAPDGGDTARLVPLTLRVQPAGAEAPRFSEGRLRLTPPPVVLVAAPGDDPSARWEPVVEQLVGEAKLPVFVLAPPAAGPAPRALWDGPGQGIREALDSLRAAGVAVTRVDVVTHAAGAAVAREWIAGRRYKRLANGMAGDVRRLITLAAPDDAAFPDVAHTPLGDLPAALPQVLEALR